jgi:hypothetical protein
MQEQWKPVRGFEGAYEVSNLGRVRRIKAACGTKVGKVLKPQPQRDGYLLVNLHIAGVLTTKMLHRLVAEAFIPNPLRLPEVNHLDSLSDCRASMLEWRSKAGHRRHHMLHNGKGVFFKKQSGKWIAQCSVEGKKLHIGVFDTKQEAINARKEALEAIPYIL